MTRFGEASRSRVRIGWIGEPFVVDGGDRLVVDDVVRPAIRGSAAARTTLGCLSLAEGLHRRAATSLPKRRGGGHGAEQPDRHDPLDGHVEGS